MLGLNVTSPVAGSIVYVPTCLPSFIAGNSVASVGSPVSGSMNLAGLSALIVIGATGSPSVNLGVCFCSCPCFPVDSTSSAVGVTGVTVGVYLAVTGVPFASFACTEIPSGVPTKSLFGVNVTSPVVGLIV